MVEGECVPYFVVGDSVPYCDDEICVAAALFSAGAALVPGHHFQRARKRHACVPSCMRSSRTVAALNVHHVNGLFVRMTASSVLPYGRAHVHNPAL